jgi:hypothetical protein
MVTRLSWREIRDLGGIRLKLAAQEVVNRRDALRRNHIPLRATLDGVQVVGVTGNQVAVSAYRRTDIQLLDKRLFEVLPVFNGQPLSDAVRAAEAQMGVPLSDGDICRLVESGVLKEM